jgi:hypothetical protein
MGNGWISYTRKCLFRWTLHVEAETGQTVRAIGRRGKIRKGSGHAEKNWYNSGSCCLMTISELVHGANKRAALMHIESLTLGDWIVSRLLLAASASRADSG